jgi:8-oxo-dGTP pyrophosphatase MutT (NUDIX family)
MLDNTVAGGISAGMGRAETVVKEAGEEAGLPEAVVRTHMRGAGAVSYFAKCDPVPRHLH